MSIESLEHVMRSRIRLFLRHTWLVTILGTLVVGGLVWWTYGYVTRAAVMRIAAGPAAGANVKFVEALMQNFTRAGSSIRLQFVSTGGPKESAQAIANGQADLAVLPSTIGNSPAWPVVAIVRKNVIALIVPAPGADAGSAKDPKPAKSTKNIKGATGAKTSKSAKTSKGAKTSKSDDSDADDDDGKLTKVPQLLGKRVGIVTGNEATTDLLNVVLNHYGVPLGQVQVSLIDPKNLADAVHANQVDAIFVAGAATGQAITNAVAAASQNGKAPGFIEIDQADGIAKRHPAFESIDIDAGTYGGNPPGPADDLKSLGFAEFLVARRSLNRNSVATLARIIYSSRLALAAAMPGEIKIEAPSTDKDGDINVHAGALAYLTDDQKSFFDRYGDDIFYGLLIFPIFGSAIAGLAGYLRRDGRTHRLRLLQCVLDLVRKAHAAPSLEAIGQLQIEADNLVIRIIHYGEHEEFDEAARMSFSVALDQLRFAIAARRMAILDRTGSKAVAA